MQLSLKAISLYFDMGKSFDGLIFFPYINAKPFSESSNPQKSLSSLPMIFSQLYLGPESLVVNVASPKIVGIKNHDLIWFENAPESGPYSNDACCYWFLKEVGDNAVGVRVTTPKDRLRYVFWRGGKPLDIGEVYHTIIALGLDSDRGLHKIIWEMNKPEFKVNPKTISQINSSLQQAVGDAPGLRLGAVKNEYLIKARDAQWEHLRPVLQYEGVI